MYSTEYESARREGERRRGKRLRARSLLRSEIGGREQSFHHDDDVVLCGRAEDDEAGRKKTRAVAVVCACEARGGGGVWLKKLHQERERAHLPGSKIAPKVPTRSVGQRSLVRARQARANSDSSLPPSQRCSERRTGPTLAPGNQQQPPLLPLFYKFRRPARFFFVADEACRCFLPTSQRERWRARAAGETGAVWCWGRVLWPRADGGKRGAGCRQADGRTLGSSRDRESVKLAPGSPHHPGGMGD